MFISPFYSFVQINFQRLMWNRGQLNVVDLEESHFRGMAKFQVCKTIQNITR